MLGKVEICGVNTAKLPTLKSDEMTELLRRSHAGDERARETLIQGNLRLVLSVIQRFASRGENADDLFQVGCVGLIKAIDNFDVSQNVRFSTYGVPMIAIPQMEEQAITARQIEKLGLGCAFLDKNAITSESLKAAIVKLLTQPSYKATAAEFSADMKSLGGAKASAEALLHFLKH